MTSIHVSYICIKIYTCIYIYIWMKPVRGPKTKFLYHLCCTILDAPYTYAPLDRRLAGRHKKDHGWCFWGDAWYFFAWAPHSESQESYPECWFAAVCYYNHLYSRTSNLHKCSVAVCMTQATYTNFLSQLTQMLCSTLQWVPLNERSVTELRIVLKHIVHGWSARTTRQRHKLYDNCSRHF